MPCRLLLAWRQKGCRPSTNSAANNIQKYTFVCLGRPNLEELRKKMAVRQLEGNSSKRRENQHDVVIYLWYSYVMGHNIFLI